MFLNFGENLLWQYKDTKPEPFLGRIGRIGSEGALSLANTFTECFKEGNLAGPRPIIHCIRMQNLRNFRILRIISELLLFLQSCHA